MNKLEDLKKSIIWYVITGKYEVLDNGKLRKRAESELKDSGVEWIGKIPKDWRVQRIKDCVGFSKGAVPIQKFEGDYPYYNGGITPTGFCDVYNVSGRTLLMSNGGANAGAITVIQQEAWIGGDCYILTADNFTEWCLMQVQEHKESYTEGSGMPHTNLRKFKTFGVPSPGNLEESKILTFLSTLDERLPGTEGIKELVDQWYKSTVWYVITGKYEVLDNGKLRKRAESELKDSGVEWIGKIPKDWETQPIKSLGDIVTGYTPGLHEDYTVPFVRPALLMGGEIEPNNTDFVEAPIINAQSLVLISCIGTIGTFGTYSGAVAFNQQIHAIVATPQNCGIICSCLRTSEFRVHLETSCKETTLKILNASRFGAVRLPKPSKAEESKVLGFLSTLDSQVSDLKERLSLL